MSKHLSIGSDRIDYQIMPGAHGQDMSVQLDGVMLQAKVARDASALYVMSGGHTEKFLDLTDDLSRFQDQSFVVGGDYCADAWPTDCRACAGR